MARFGAPKLIDLNAEIEVGLGSYAAQVGRGQRSGAMREKLVYLLRANYAYNYINLLRKSSNHPRFISTVGKIERWLANAFSGFRVSSAAARQFMQSDFYLEDQLIVQEDIAAFCGELDAQDVYHDPYVENSSFNTPESKAASPFLYMDYPPLFQSEAFLRLCACEGIIQFCQEVLGPSAAVTWAWAWISQPGHGIYQNQNWHRDSSEPLNFIRVFIPLNDINSDKDGPTVLIPQTATHEANYVPKRYSDDEISDIRDKFGQQKIYCKVGDVYFVNTFCLHRGMQPNVRRSMLTLLVSLSPSHRTPTICPVACKSLSASLQSRITKHRRFFRHLVK